MADKRIRDDPPLFTISSNTAAFKYHAVLVERVWLPTKLIVDVRDQDASSTRVVEGILEAYTPAGIYGFHTVEARDKFCRRCNVAADMEEHKVCLPFTIPLEHLANAQSLITGPVAKANQEGNPQ